MSSSEPAETTLDFRKAKEADFDALTQWRATSAEDDHFDPLSTMESLPSSAELRALAEQSSYFCVVWSGGRLVGYGLVRWWDEDSGTRVILCDWYLAAAFQELNQRLLDHLESQAISLGFDEATAKRSVIATNASSVQSDRTEIILRSGFSETFTQIEMEWRNSGLDPASLPPGLEIRNVRVEDAQALIDLTQRVWANREFFTLPTVEKFDSWLRRSDLGLFDVAVKGGGIIAFVASIPRASAAEIDDVQVDPRFQRMGIARALVTRNLQTLVDRGFNVVRLNTEAHDPAGARSLYEQLGFRVVRSYVRYRKPLPFNTTNL